MTLAASTTLSPSLEPSLRTQIYLPGIAAAASAVVVVVLVVEGRLFLLRASVCEYATFDDNRRASEGTAEAKSR